LKKNEKIIELKEKYKRKLEKEKNILYTFVTNYFLVLNNKFIIIKYYVKLF